MESWWATHVRMLVPPCWQNKPPTWRRLSSSAMCVFCQQSRDPPRNVFSAVKNKVLMGLTEGGMQHLMAGARASVGVKTGRCLVKLRPSGHGTRVKVVFGSVVSRVADDPTNSNNECSISQVKIKHELCNTTLSCLPFAAWSFGPLCVMSDHHVNYVSRIMFMKFHEGITTSDILRVQWNYPKLWAKSKVRDPTTKPLRNWWQNPWKFPWGSTAPARHENFRIFLRGENPGEFYRQWGSTRWQGWAVF